MLNNAVVSVWLAFLVHFSPKIKIGTVILRILQYLASQLVMVSTRRGQDYQEDGAIVAAIAEDKAASDAATKADTAAAAIAAVAVASEAEDKAKDIEAAIFDFDESVDMDDEGVAEGVDEAKDVGAGSKISAGDDRGDVDGGGMVWATVGGEVAHNNQLFSSDVDNNGRC